MGICDGLNCKGWPCFLLLAAAARPATSVESLNLTKVTNASLIVLFALMLVREPRQALKSKVLMSSNFPGKEKQLFFCSLSPLKPITAPSVPWLPFCVLLQKLIHIYKYHVVDVKQQLFPRRLWKHLSEEEGYTSSECNILWLSFLFNVSVC
eukprot:1138860-Pelagomonas_calceolata.AAC.5